MQKMGARNMVELVWLCMGAGVAPNVLDIYIAEMEMKAAMRAEEQRQKQKLKSLNVGETLHSRGGTNNA